MAKKLKRFNGTTWDNIDILASDSELLGGLALNSSTTNNQANKIIRTNASGETHLGLIKTIVGTTTTGSANVFIDTGDGFIRKKALSSFISELNIDPDTNNYLTGVSGSGNGTVTFARQGLASLTWNAGHTHTFASLTSKPTNLSGYGITDAYTQAQINAKTYLKSDTDNRAVATVPNDYNSKFEIKGLKTNTAIGLTSGATYSGVLGIRGWTDSSGGNAHELAFDGNGGIYHRHGATTAWNAWKKLAYSEDVAPSTHAHGAIANNGGITATATPAATDFLLISDSSDAAKIKSAIELTGSTDTFLNGSGAFSTPPNTNNYLTSVSGSGNGTVTFTRSGITPNLTWNASHTHSNYLTTTGTAYNSTRFGEYQLRVGEFTSGLSGYISLGY